MTFKTLKTIKKILEKEIIGLENNIGLFEAELEPLELKEDIGEISDYEKEALELYRKEKMQNLKKLYETREALEIFLNHDWH